MFYPPIEDEERQQNDSRMTSNGQGNDTNKNVKSVYCMRKRGLPEIGQSYFIESTYINERGREYKCYAFGKDGMTTYKSDTKKTVINVVNYSVYHDEEIEKTSRTHHENDTEKNVKNEQNVNFTFRVKI